MVDPLSALIVAIVFLLAASALFWPEKGIVPQIKRNSLNTQRVSIEDALKHIYDCEYNQNSCSVNSIAGTLGISGDASAKLVSKLESMSLTKSEHDGIHLTNSGRSYALRVIRIHRLWERYLADETSVKETDWHNQAEFMEHTLSEDDANELARRLSNPLVDPHGDPIPTPTGEIPNKNWQSLKSLNENQVALITHLEDEPAAIYAQLIAEGLYVGMQVRIIEVSHDRVRFIADDEEVVLAPIFAANISVAPVKEDTSIHSEFKRLSSLKQGEEVTVVGISKACRGLQRRRLLDFGVVPGSKIKAKLTSLGGDPSAYEIKGALIALRKNQADQIYIKENEL